MDEAGLFYRAIPNRSYLAADEGDSRQVGRGCKSMKAKEHVTIILCVNSTGSCKMTPVVIGSAKNPRCFKQNPPCLPYFLFHISISQMHGTTLLTITSGGIIFFAYCTQ